MWVVVGGGGVGGEGAVEGQGNRQLMGGVWYGWVAGGG